MIEGVNKNQKENAMDIIDEGENVSSKRVVVSDFEIEEPNCMNGVPWISYVDNGEECNEPIFISFKDLAMLFRNEGIEPDGGNDGRYHFTKTPVMLGNYFGIEIDDALFSLRSCFVIPSEES